MRVSGRQISTHYQIQRILTSSLELQNFQRNVLDRSAKRSTTGLGSLVQVFKCWIPRPPNSNFPLDPNGLFPYAQNETQADIESRELHRVAPEVLLIHLSGNSIFVIAFKRASNLTCLHFPNRGWLRKVFIGARGVSKPWRNFAKVTAV